MTNRERFNIGTGAERVGECCTFRATGCDKKGELKEMFWGFATAGRVISCDRLGECKATDWENVRQQIRIIHVII